MCAEVQLWNNLATFGGKNACRAGDKAALLDFCAAIKNSFKSMTLPAWGVLAHNLINRICAEVGTSFAEYIRGA
jgi:hypothetical protein